jgi:hypothetical protein
MLFGRPRPERPVWQVEESDSLERSRPCQIPWVGLVVRVLQVGPPEVVLHTLVLAVRFGRHQPWASNIIAITSWSAVEWGLSTSASTDRSARFVQSVSYSVVAEFALSTHGLIPELVRNARDRK